MNIQLKKGLVEICVLAIINREASYGYKIISDLKNIIELSESTLYPILRRLESGGYLKTFTLNYSGRLRRYYQITESGKRRIREFKNEWFEMETVYHFIVHKEDQ